jgi:hypothetical protein
MTAEKMTVKLAKLKALAENGVGGEKETAKRMYKELREKYGISEEAVAAVAEPTAEEVKQELSSISFALWVLANNLAEEAEACARCALPKGAVSCEDCATKQNRIDLERQYEDLKGYSIP